MQNLLKFASIIEICFKRSQTEKAIYEFGFSSKAKRVLLILFTMGFSGGAHGWGRAKRPFQK